MKCAPTLGRIGELVNASDTPAAVVQQALLC